MNWWIDQLAPKAWAVVAAGTCAAYGGIHAMAGHPTGRMGLADYLGWDFQSQGELPIVNVPGCPIQAENVMETLTWVLYHAAGSANPGRLDDAAAEGRLGRLDDVLGQRAVGVRTAGLERVVGRASRRRELEREAASGARYRPIPDRPARYH